MGGDTYLPSLASTTEEESSLGQDESVNFSVTSGDEEGLSHKLETSSVINEESGLNFGEFSDVGPRRTSSIKEAAERQKLKVYAEVSRSYEEFQSRVDRLEEAKTKILSYKPGLWSEKEGGMDPRDSDVPTKTSLLLIGPKGSGKSSLVNKISRVLEDNIFLSERAQVSYNSSAGGTYFLHEYKVPRVSGSFCLYDTRGLSVDPSENLNMFEGWMTKGVRHGELIKRNSDSRSLKAQLQWKARRSCSSRQFTDINFVIFVVNGLSVLESMDSVDEEKKRYCQMIETNFNCPLLSFKDDKPVVVVTHGDLMSLSDRVRVRVYLNELLGVSPTSQIFDIPDNDDSATTLAIVDMLNQCLERADRNLPTNESFMDKAFFVDLLVWLVVAIAVVYGVFCFVLPLCPRRAPTTPPPMKIEWPKIRHMWSE